MKHLSFLSLLLMVFGLANAQTNTFPSTGSAGIGTLSPNASSALDIVSTTQGVLVPRMTKTERDAIASPATGLLIYQTNNTPGFYYYDGIAWKAVSPAGANKTLSNLAGPTAVGQLFLPDADNLRDVGSISYSWKDIYLDGSVYLDGSRFISNPGTDNLVTGLGSGAAITTGSSNAMYGNNAGHANTTGSNNLFTGTAAGYSNTTGNDNSATGYQALYSNTNGWYNAAHGSRALYSNTAGWQNTAMGFYTLYSNTTAWDNSALGSAALFSNTTGSGNTATGSAAMYFNTTGYSNTANGNSALGKNTTGSYNSAVGASALYKNTTASYNSAFGYSALYNNTTGYNNTASGYQALYSNTWGEDNTANGYQALYSNTDGNDNTANGYQALYSNFWGDDNTANGYQALYSNTLSYGNTANGFHALYSNTWGGLNTATGYGAGSYNDGNSYCSFFGYGADQSVTTDFTNSMALGNGSRITASNQVRVGNSSITSIGGYTSWTNLSDGRYKKNVREDVPGLQFIARLKPVTYTMDVANLRKFLGEDITGEENREGFLPPSDEQKSLIDKGVKEKEQILYTGFIAQDVEKAAKEIGYDFSGVDAPKNENDLYGLRYAEFVVPLVKAVQELDQENGKLKIENSKQQTQLDELNKSKDETIQQLSEELLKEKSENASQQTQIEAQQNQIDELKQMVNSLIGNSSPSEKTSSQTIELGSEAKLEQNVPNPFDNSTVISYYLPGNTHNASINIYDASGHVLKSVVLEPGQGQLILKAGELAAGSYSYSLFIGGRLIDSKKMELVK